MKRFLLAVAPVALLSAAGQAQPAFPAKPMRLIAHAAPGGSLDILARSIFDVRAWFGALAPAATPRDVVNRLNREIVALPAKPEVRERLGKIGLDVNPSTPEQFAAFIAAEIAKWAPVLKASGVSVD